jgi:hypothetical protein
MGGTYLAVCHKLLVLFIGVGISFGVDHIVSLAGTGVKSSSKRERREGE